MLPSENLNKLIDMWKEITIKECNYENEIANMKTVRELIADEQIIIPKTYDDFSTSEIITMDKISGLRFEDFLYRSTQDEKDHIGKLIMSSYLRLLQKKYFRADVHQGNYMIVGNKLAMIDLAHLIGPEELKETYFLEFLEAIIANNTTAVREVLEKERWQNAQSVTDETIDEIIRTFSKPYQGNHFQFTPDYARKIFNFSVGREMSGLRLPQTARPSMRFFWSVYGLLGKLGATNNWKELVEAVSSNNRANPPPN